MRMRNLPLLLKNIKEPLMQLDDKQVVFSADPEGKP